MKIPVLLILILFSAITTMAQTGPRPRAVTNSAAAKRVAVSDGTNLNGGSTAANIEIDPAAQSVTITADPTTGVINLNASNFLFNTEEIPLNSAPANTIPKSDGVDLTASRITDDGTNLALSTSVLKMDATVTAGGTTGAQTINKALGSVNFAATATSLVVTNSTVASTSVVICTVATNDTTLKAVQCVAGSGSFTMFGNAAATAETRVNFLVVTPQ